MTKFSIEYNPYLVECIFKKNGKPVNRSSKIGAKANERLQVLLGKQGNWEGLLEEISRACDDDHIELSFKGRKIDYDDLKYAIDLYEGETKFKLLPNQKVTNDADIIKELDRIFGEIKKKNLPNFKVKNKDGMDIFDTYKKVKNGIFDVNVIATMSSGKSTLLNSLLHTELLPAYNKPTTATIAEIYDCDGMKGYEAVCYRKDKNTVVYPQKKVLLEDIENYNQDKNVTYIEIKGDIPGITSGKIQLCLRDTPGPNNSNNLNHEQLTKKLIKQTKAVVLYIINATQLGINDDNNLLHEISEEMKKAGKQSRDRFIFVVNKADQLDEEKGETLDKLLETVREYLKKFGITDPILIPTSAYHALLIRKKRAEEKLTRNEKNVFANLGDYIDCEELHFEKYATLTPSIESYLQKEVDKYQKNEDEWDLEALIHTGVPVVEQTLNEYIEKYAYPMKIKDAINDIMGILNELDMKTKFEKLIAEDGEKLKQVREQIKEAKEKFAKSNVVYAEFKERISSLNIDEAMKDDEILKLEKELDTMSMPYNGAKKVDKLKADQMVQTFVKNLEDYQEKFKSRIDREIDSKIYKNCTEIFEEYKKTVSDILYGIEIEGFDFQKVSSVERIKIHNVDSILQTNQQDRYREETRWERNPERMGFFGFFKFWEPKWISYTEKVKDGVDVNVNQVVVDIMAKFLEQMQENVVNIFEQAERQVNEYKDVFAGNIDDLKDEIGNILEELKVKTASSDKLSRDVENNKQLKHWVEEIEQKLDNVLRF